MPAIDNNISREHWVATDNLPNVRAVIDKLQRKAMRHNLPSPQLSVTDDTMIDKVNVYEDGTLVKKDFPVNKTKIIVSGEFPRFSDYQFLAKIDHTVSDTQNVVLTPGAEFESELENTGIDFHSCSSGCDHCGLSRDRNETFVVKNTKSNKVLQVGSTCVDDYVGTKTLPQLMAAFDINAIVYDVAFLDDMENEFSRGSYNNSVESRLLLAVAIEDIDNNGFRPSKTEYPTWQHVIRVLNRTPNMDYFGDEIGVLKAHNAEQSHPSLEKADKVIDWIMSLDSKDSKSSFIKNMQVVLGTGYVGITGDSVKYAAMVASLPNSFNKEIGKRMVKGEVVNEPFGQEKQRGRLKLTVVNMKEPDPYDRFPSTKVMMIDSSGRRFSWKSSGYNNDVKVGETYLLTGTIKSHNEWQGTHYTNLSRCADFETANESTPIPDFSAKIKPADKPKVSLDQSIFNFGFNPRELDYKVNVSRSWKEGRARFDSDFSASINEDTTFEELKALYVEELSLVGSVHLLKQVQTGSDEVIDRLKAAFDERQSLRNMPDTVIGRVVQDASINAFAIDHRLENPTVKDIFVELPVIAQSNVGDFDASDYDQNVKVMDVKHTSQKTLGITSSEFEALGRDSYMMTSILENLADKGYDRLVVSGGNGASVFVPSVKGTNALAPENVEILARGMQVPDEQNLVIKSQDKKVLFMSSDAPVEFNSISIDMLTTYIENGEPELLLVPPITAQKGAVYDSLNAIINELEKVPETKAETGLSIGGYPDMPSVLRKAGATVTHVHISHEDGHLSPYFDEHVKGADMEIKVKSDQNLNDLMKSKAVAVSYTHLTLPTKRIV